MVTKYEIGESSFDQCTNTTNVPIVMSWPYGDPTPPILQSGQMLYVYSKKYIITGLEYEPAFETGEEHTITYLARRYTGPFASAPWEDED